MKNIVSILIALICGIGSMVASNEYATIAKLARANGKANAFLSIRSMADGCRYTFVDKEYIKCCSYASHTDTTILFKADFNIGSYALSADESKAIVENPKSIKKIYRHSYTADYYLLNRQGCTKILSAVRDVTFSPDGTKIAFCKENNLFLYDIATANITPITTDGEWNKIINGTSDWVYEEEYAFTCGYAFSNDGKNIAYLRFDESEVPTFELMRYDNTLYNKGYSFKYPKAGDKNSVVQLWLYDTTTGEKNKIDVGPNPDQYIFNIGYTPANELYFYRVNRLQNHFEVILCHKNGEQNVIYSESSDKYVDRPNGSTITFIDGTRFIVSEQTTTGYTHLYLHSTTKGRVNAITSGKFCVTNLVKVTDNRIYYLSTEISPLNRNFYSIGLNGKGKKLLGSKDGTYVIKPSATAKYYVEFFSAENCANIVSICNNSGQVIADLIDCNKAVKAIKGRVERHFETFVTEHGDTLNYYIQYPINFDPTKKYPLLLTQYSGPASQEVQNHWKIDWEDAMPNLGYIVACVDGRGTGFRGEAFQKCTYGCLGKYEVEDQLGFAKYLSKLDYIDSNRIGIYGWSYGGYMALNCALRGEGLFKMAIAVAPVVSWRYYDSIYTEIYNGLPADNPSGYDDYSPLGQAKGLAERTQLLIIHGTADDNVHFQNSMEMCRRLNQAKKQYDMMVYPDQNHSMLPSCSANIRQKMIDYTKSHL